MEHGYPFFVHPNFVVIIPCIHLLLPKLAHVGFKITVNDACIYVTVFEEEGVERSCRRINHQFVLSMMETFIERKKMQCYNIQNVCGKQLCLVYNHSQCN